MVPGAAGGDGTNANSGGSSGPLDRKLCQVVGVNQNYTSSSGTLYHIQIEDRGPVLDRVSEREVRRVNVIAYANYGEPNVLATVPTSQFWRWHFSYLVAIFRSSVLDRSLLTR